MSILGKRKREQRTHKHPYLTGNFTPIYQTRPLTPCSSIGKIPDELAGGQYVRNGGNPVSNEDLGRDAHWFDGDGMLAGVTFRRSAEEGGAIRPEFVNQYILTDLYLSTLETNPSSPILPSIATLVNPASSLLRIIWRIFRTMILVMLSHLPGSNQKIKKISVANTGIYYHDGRALATCESGPPIRIALPGLETVGWFDGHQAEGEACAESKEVGIGGSGVLSFMKEWTTGHPKIDPGTNEMMLFHSTFVPPYTHYSVIPGTQRPETARPSLEMSRLLNAPVPKVSGAKMMHDFGVSRTHSVILDLPLSLDPLNLLKNKPVVSYDSSKSSRFGVFPRHNPEVISWFETCACCIFHTANTWDTYGIDSNVSAVNMLACRLTSASLVFSAGNIAAPQPTQRTVDEVVQATPTKPMPFFEKYDYDDIYDKASDTIQYTQFPEFQANGNVEAPTLERQPLLSQKSSNHSNNGTFFAGIEEEQCRLYYYQFSLDPNNETPQITYQFALSAIPFEFPTLRTSCEMSLARYIYGCSTSTTSFGAALGRSVKIDVLAKMDVKQLLAKGQESPPRSITGCVDTRTVGEILRSEDERDAIRCFKMPEGWYAQEPRFVPRTKRTSDICDPTVPANDRDNDDDEDDGFLLFYAFDESQLDAEGECPPDATSELWIIDAKYMRDIVCRVQLPQRVPYGLHGNWFTEEQIREQRPLERVRREDNVLREKGAEKIGHASRVVRSVRKKLVKAFAGM